MEATLHTADNTAHNIGIYKSWADGSTIGSKSFITIIDKGLKIAENLSTVWTSSTFDEKLKLQTLVFPEGIVYSKKTDTVRNHKSKLAFRTNP